MGNHLYCSPRSCRVALTALTAPALLTCCLLWVAACSDSGEAEGWCGDHAAQCPGDWDTSRGACEAFCGTGKPGASTHDDCKFAYCSVQVSKCDNQEPGDTSIMSCIQQLQGSSWCATHATQCPGDWDSSRGACETFCGTGKPGTSTHDDCKFAYCSVQVGKCDNQEPGDTSIKACVNQL